MNPSATGWVKKYESHYQKKANCENDWLYLYERITSVGFVYGLHFKAVEELDYPHPLLPDEIAKINLIYTLSEVHSLVKCKRDFQSFLSDVLNFYKPLKNSHFWSIHFSNDPYSNFESFVDKRINNYNNSYKQWLGKGIINPFLIHDCIGFYLYLTQGVHIFNSLNFLKRKLIKYAKQSSYFISLSNQKLFPIFIAELTADKKLKGVEKQTIEDRTLVNQYLLDFNCILIYGQTTIEQETEHYLKLLSEELHLNQNTLLDSTTRVKAFTNTYSTSFESLKNSNTISRIYNSIQYLAEKIILRNSKRIIKELMQSKELLVLLSKSTHKSLSVKERERIQLLSMDIVKSVPSLAIFMLPGGAVLLPLFIKMIPKLLPSAFDENRIEE